MLRRTAPLEPDTPDRPSFEADLQALHERLVAEGLHGGQLASVIEAARQLASQPDQATHVRAALRNPAALAERIRAVAARSNTPLAALGCFLLGAIAGPLLVYGALGSPWHSYPLSLPRWLVGALGIVAIALLLAVAARYSRPAELGALAGVGGGIAEVALASMPWLAVASTRPACQAQTLCTVPVSVALGYGAVAAIVFALPFTVALAGVAGLVGHWAERARFMAAIRQSR